MYMTNISIPVCDHSKTKKSMGKKHQKPEKQRQKPPETKRKKNINQEKNQSKPRVKLSKPKKFKKKQDTEVDVKAFRDRMERVFGFGRGQNKKNGGILLSVISPNTLIPLHDKLDKKKSRFRQFFSSSSSSLLFSHLPSAQNIAFPFLPSVQA